MTDSLREALSASRLSVEVICCEAGTDSAWVPVSPLVCVGEHVTQLSGLGGIDIETLS